MSEGAIINREMENHKAPDSLAGWNRYEKFVLKELHRHSADISVLEEENKLIRERLSAVEVRSGVIGAVSGFLAALGTGLVALILAYAKG